MNQLGLVQPVDRLGQRVVVAVALAADRGFDARFGQPLGVADQFPNLFCVCYTSTAMYAYRDAGWLGYAD
jgi:hypothetical protein